MVFLTQPIYATQGMDYGITKRISITQQMQNVYGKNGLTTVVE